MPPPSPRRAGDDSDEEEVCGVYWKVNTLDLRAPGPSVARQPKAPSSVKPASPPPLRTAKRRRKVPERRAIMEDIDDKMMRSVQLLSQKLTAKSASVPSPAAASKSITAHPPRRVPPHPRSVPPLRLPTTLTSHTTVSKPFSPAKSPKPKSKPSPPPTPRYHKPPSASRDHTTVTTSIKPASRTALLEKQHQPVRPAPPDPLPEDLKGKGKLVTEAEKQVEEDYFADADGGSFELALSQLDVVNVPPRSSPPLPLPPPAPKAHKVTATTTKARVVAAPAPRSPRPIPPKPVSRSVGGGVKADKVMLQGNFASEEDKREKEALAKKELDALCEGVEAWSDVDDF